MWDVAKKSLIQNYVYNQNESLEQKIKLSQFMNNSPLTGPPLNYLDFAQSLFRNPLNTLKVIF